MEWPELLVDGYDCGRAAAPPTFVGEGCGPTTGPTTDWHLDRLRYRSLLTTNVALARSGR